MIEIEALFILGRVMTQRGSKRSTSGASNDLSIGLETHCKSLLSTILRICVLFIMGIIL